MFMLGVVSIMSVVYALYTTPMGSVFTEGV